MVFAEKVYLLCLYIRCFLRERKRWRKAPAFRETTPLVYYGYDEIPGKDQIVSGGMVKAQDLITTFPNTTAGANITYLISSSLPHYASVMLKAAKKCGCKVVVNQNGTASLGWYGDGWQKANIPLKQALDKADYIVFQSSFCKQAADLHLGKRDTPSEVLHNPVDTDFFTPSREGFRHRLLLAGSHHQFYRVKSALDTLIHLLPHQPSAGLTIAGKYRWLPDEEQCKDQMLEYIRSKGLTGHITVEGAYTQKEARKLFQNHDILIHTKYNDPCPRLVVEALSSGLPIAYSCSGGVPELVGEAGIGIPAPIDWDNLHPPDPELLAGAVDKIFHNYDTFSQKARERAVAQFDVKPWLKKHAEIFRMLLTQ
jgi:glycosyltransferase involved in cell wall biosynthesis